jgi:hypothetical protein
MKKSWWIFIIIFLIAFLCWVLYDNVIVKDEVFDENFNLSEMENESVLIFKGVKLDDDYYEEVRVQYCEGLDDGGGIRSLALECCLSDLEKIKREGYVAVPYGEKVCPNGSSVSGSSYPYISACINGGSIPFCFIDE